MHFDVGVVDADGDVATQTLDVAIIGGNVFTGTADAEVINGGPGADTMNAGDGNDILIFDPTDIPGVAATVYDGGAGTDMLRFAASGQTLNLTTLDDAKIQNIEVIDLTGTGNNTLVLNDADVAALSSTTNQLIVQGNAGDAVTVTGGWTQGTDQVIDGQTYATYTHGSGASMATLLIDTDVSRTVT